MSGEAASVAISSPDLRRAGLLSLKKLGADLRRAGPPKSLDHVKKIAMQAQVAAEFGMERRRQYVTLAHHDAVAVSLGEQFDRGSASLDPWSANEYAGERLAAERVDVQFDLGRLVLAAERVPSHRDVDETERRLLEPVNLARCDDHSHARSPQRHSGPNALHNRLGKTGTIEQFHNGCRFAAGYDQRVDVREIRRCSYFAGECTSELQRRGVFDDVALQR